MGSGLQALKRQKQENREREEARNRPKAAWFGFPKGVTQVKVRFLQELDEEAENYKSDRGTGQLAVEHTSPADWKRRASCSMDSEGRCLACSRHQEDYNAGWKQKQNYYINALVELPGETPKVMMLTRNFNSPFMDQLIEFAEDDGTITNKNFRLTKTGEGTKTSWLLKELKEEPFDDTGVEVFNIAETALREIPFDKQDEYYGASEKKDEPKRERDAASELQDW